MFPLPSVLCSGIVGQLYQPLYSSFVDSTNPETHLRRDKCRTFATVCLPIINAVSLEIETMFINIYRVHIIGWH